MEDVAALVRTDNGTASRTACSACHRRKLKCDRVLAGCSNCTKSNIPCIYSTSTSTSKNQNGAVDKGNRRRPRGPYQKGKTPREKELEHVVELLQSKCEGLQDQLQTLQLVENDSSSPQTIAPVQTAGCGSTKTGLVNNASSISSFSSPLNAPLATTSEHLSHQSSPFTNSSPASFPAFNGSTHPSQSQILHLWILFQSHIDPVTKLLHIPTMSERVLLFMNDPAKAEVNFEFLMFTIYHAVVVILSPEKVYATLGQSKDKILATYQSFFDQSFAMINLCSSPDLLQMQALLLYLSAVRRNEGYAPTSGAIFGMAVRIAQLLGFDRDEYPSGTAPIEIELRRRCWWTLCRYESSLAEELPRRKLSIMQWSDIPLPGNYNDTDFAAGVMEHPEPRRGLTEMSLAILVQQVIKLNGRINRALSSEQKALDSVSLPPMLKTILQDTRHAIENEILAYCDVSRPMDWLIMLCAKVMLTKVEILALEPPSGQSSKNKDLVTIFMDKKLSLSLDVIECHQLMSLDGKLTAWNWAFRNAQQVYAIAYVLEDLVKRPQSLHSSRAWILIDMLFSAQGSLSEKGEFQRQRDSLLELHGKAQQVRANVQNSGTSPSFFFPPSKYAFGKEAQGVIADPNTAHAAASTHALDALQAYTTNDPWLFDDTLLDIEGTEVNIDAFFWPSAEDTS